MAPTFSGAPQGSPFKKTQEEEYQNFSFKPHEPSINVTKVSKNNPIETSLNHEHETGSDAGGGQTPGWGL